MSEMEVSENDNDCSNDLLLLDRVFLRLGNADTDEQLESCLSRFLAPVILKLSSPHEQVRTKVMELLVHVNKRIKCRSDVQLPVDTLLTLYKDPKANSFIINFTIIYITMGFPRLPKDQQVALAPSLIEAIENKPQSHQDGILILVMPLLGEIKEANLNLKEKPKAASLILKFASDMLLLPYRALPISSDSDFQVPPGMSLSSYKRIVDKTPVNANQLEEMKLSIVNFISKDIFNSSDILLPLIVAAADSRFSVANNANSPLIRVASSVDWSLPSVVAPLVSLYLGTFGGVKVKPEDRKVAACTRLRLKLIQYLNKATGPAIMFPHCVQVVFSSLFDVNSNSRLKNMALMHLMNVINNGDATQLKKVASIFLQGLLKLIRSDEFVEQHVKAYMCLGRLTMKCPQCVNNQFTLLEELVKKIPEALPEMKTALRDALLEMATAYRIYPEVPEEAMDTTTEAAGSSVNSPMDTDEASESKKAKTSKFDEPQALALFALLELYMQSEESMIRYIATRYAAAVFPRDYIPSRYLLLLASGDSQDEISNEALKNLYGTSRTTEIRDVINNVSASQTSLSEPQETLKIPQFEDIVGYVWEQMQKRKKGSNAKHRFVIGNQVLQYHPGTYQEILRYLRMCLNHNAGLKDCSEHPNATSPLLARYIQQHLLDTEVLDRYLTMITSLLSASAELMPLSCFLDIIGCVPDKMSAKYTSLLPFFHNLFTTSTKEDIRENSALIYSFITVYTADKRAIDREISNLIECSSKSLEAQCGMVSAAANICERCIILAKNNKFGGKGFAPKNWEPYQAVALCLANYLTSNQQLLVSVGCSNIALIARCSGLPLADCTDAQRTLLQSDHPFDITKNAPEPATDPVTKYSVVDRLFRIVGNVKLPSKTKEKALYTLGLLCCGERFVFAKEIVGAFLRMAKDSKEFEIHLQIGESLVLCVESVNSNENRDLWTELPKEGEAKVKDVEALRESDELLEWVLAELHKISKLPHPHSRQATSIWLLALLKNCPERKPIKDKLQQLQDIFMDFLSENSEIVQDVGSKGLSLVYANSATSEKQALVQQIIEQFSGGRRAVTAVTDDTKLFEEGQLGKTPTGGNLSTYKELCSLASDLNQPDLLYKFMHLAHHNSVWNSKKGAAFGFQSIALQAGNQLSEQLPKIVPRLYRYRFDPTPRIQNSMASIWSALVPNTQATVQKYHTEILDELINNMVANEWRVRMSCCLALSELLRGACGLQQSAARLPQLWARLYRVMDDVHEGTRQAAGNTATVLSKLCIRASDVSHGNSGRVIVAAILPVLLDTGITNVVREVRSVSLQTVSKLVSAAGETLVPFLPKLIPALLLAGGELESSKLSYLSTALGNDHSTREMLDDLRANAARQHYTTDTVVKCMPYIDIASMTEMLPKILELTKSPQLGTKVACCHFFILATHQLRSELEPVAGKVMSVLLNGAFDRNATVRKNFAEALGQVAACAKESSVEKLMKKLISFYDTREDDVTKSVVALILKSVSKAKIELIKENEEIIAPTVFLAMHGSKDEDSATVESYEEIWTDISPGRETGIKKHLAPIRLHLEQALSSNSWTKKIQAANAIRTICRELSSGLGDQRELFIRALLASVAGKTFDGKQHVLYALADLCEVKDGEAPISGIMTEECLNALLLESRKQDLTYKRHAITALGHALAATGADKFNQLYEIVKLILSKDELSIENSSEEEDSETGRSRREQLSALQQAAYELLGNAWPSEIHSQDKYREVFFGHCSRAYPTSSRSTQLAILTAVTRVTERLAILSGDVTAMEVDDSSSSSSSSRERAVAAVTEHVVALLDHTLKNNNQVRHRRDALHIMDILIKKLKELNYTEDLNKLRAVYQRYASELSKDSSHEIRAKLDNIKVHFK